MPGRGRGRGKRGKGMRGFLRYCLLFMVFRDDAHGYSLLDGLDEFGFDRERLDPSLVYRALRDLEGAGWVESYWGEESQGPPRRIYRILPEGEAFLKEWIKELQSTRTVIDRLINAYEQETGSR